MSGGQRVMADAEFDVGGWMERLARHHEQTYGKTRRHPGERLMLKVAYEERYGEKMDPATDDPLELAVIDAMWTAYFAEPSPRLDSPETFWPMAKYIYLPGMAREAIRVMRERTAPTQAALPLEDAA